MITTVFPDIVYTGQMPNHASLKERFMKGLEKTSFPKTNWDCDVDTTFNQPYTDNSDVFPWDEYFEGVRTNLSIMSKELGSPPFQGAPHSAWVNVYRQGQFQERHDHIERETTCSVIYFVNYDHDLDARVSFHNSKSLEYKYSNFNCLFPQDLAWYVPEVKEGDVIIFPGFLEHFVGKQQGDRIRVTASSNIMISPVEEK